MSGFTRHHGMVRGVDGVPASQSFEGRFGRIFRRLPAALFSPQALHLLAEKMIAEPDNPPTPETLPDDEENSGISAGYTYLGQFIDHDLTFDPNSSLQKQNDPNALVDFRTPRFDLDSLYGRGPDDQPYLYTDDGLHMLLGRPLTGSASDPNTRDLPRNTPANGEPKRALIGDPRNDENVIVSQLQGMFLRFHNRIVDVTGTDDFETAQRLTRWHYQWVVLHDFLPTIIGHDTLNSILPHLAEHSTIQQHKPVFRAFDWKKNPFMPVEFSVAAYRFGHSMVRPLYRLNQTIPRFPIFSADGSPNLAGFQEFPSNWAIDWNLFFKMGSPLITSGPTRLQPAYKIDTSLVNPLGTLPRSIAPHDSVSLAERNLLRGLRMGLPSGQNVARRLGEAVIPDDQLRVGKATEADTDGNPTLESISAEFSDNAPLWYYILAEAQQAFQNNSTPIRLGPVGGRIVGEVFVGLLHADQHSFWNYDPHWRPFEHFMEAGRFGIAELIAQAKLAQDVG